MGKKPTTAARNSAPSNGFCSMNPFYRPIKHQLTLRVDADVVAWLGRKGKGCQTRANAVV